MTLFRLKRGRVLRALSYLCSNLVPALPGLQVHDFTHVVGVVCVLGVSVRERGEADDGALVLRGS